MLLHTVAARVGCILVTLTCLEVAAETIIETAALPESSFADALAPSKVLPPVVDPQSAVEVSNTARALTIALLMPSDDSMFLSAAQIVSNGLIAASKTSAVPAQILSIASDGTTSVLEQLNAAVLAGADVAVGPLQRDLVAQLAEETHLPLPVVALNLAPEAASTSPEELVMMSVSTELEAEYIARLAVAALPEPSERYGAPRVAVMASGKPWEERIAAVYRRVLTEAGIAYVDFTASAEGLEDLRAALEPVLEEETKLEFAQQRRDIEHANANDAARKRRLLRALHAKERARIATSEPPFAAALLALDPQTASLVRNRIPLRTRVWATSSTNPGDPKTSSTSAALSYDLDNLVFGECPLVVRYDAASFEARFETAMPYSLSAKRLFALGVDAYETAQQWASRRPVIQFHGETGAITLDRSHSALVNRTPQTVVVKSGHLVEVPPEVLSKKGDMPKIMPPPETPASASETPAAEPATPVNPAPAALNTFEAPASSTVAPVAIIVDAVSEDPAPTPPVAALPTASPVPAAPALPEGRTDGLDADLEAPEGAQAEPTLSPLIHDEAAAPQL